MKAVFLLAALVFSFCFAFKAVLDPSQVSPAPAVAEISAASAPATALPPQALAATRTH